MRSKKDIIRKWLPKSAFGSFIFTCPICGGRHVKELEFIYEVSPKREGYNLTSYTQNESTPICRECTFSRDERVREKIQAYIKDQREKLMALRVIYRKLNDMKKAKETFGVGTEGLMELANELGKN